MAAESASNNRVKEREGANLASFICKEHNGSRTQFVQQNIKQNDSRIGRYSRFEFVAIDSNIPGLYRTDEQLVSCAVACLTQSGSDWGAACIMCGRLFNQVIHYHRPIDKTQTIRTEISASAQCLSADTADREGNSKIPLATEYSTGIAADTADRNPQPWIQAFMVCTGLQLVSQ